MYALLTDITARSAAARMAAAARRAARVNEGRLVM